MNGRIPSIAVEKGWGKVMGPISIYVPSEKYLLPLAQLEIEPTAPECPFQYSDNHWAKEYATAFVNLSEKDTLRCEVLES